MKHLLEKISLLSLSLMLVSTFAVSPALPQMLTYYQAQGISGSQVELLVSLSSFAILTMLLLTPWLSRVLSERLTIILGLLLLAAGGGLPVLTQTYALVFVSRLILGCGIGLINARAINIISERFTGKERVRMLGLRGSAEVLGSAVLTFLVGQLIGLRWSVAFGIYLLALPILLLYLLFVPKVEPTQVESTHQPAPKLTGKQLLYITGMAAYAGFVILVNSSNTLRIPLVVESLKLGTASQSSLILSLMMLMGILAGTLFSNVVTWLRGYFMALVALILGAGMVVLWLAHSLFGVAIGALLTGFVYSLGVTYVFHAISEKLPANQLNTATTLVLLGCNLGGGCASLVLQLFGLFSSSLTAAFGILAALSLGLGLLLLVLQVRRRKIS